MESLPYFAQLMSDPRVKVLALPLNRLCATRIIYFLRVEEDALALAAEHSRYVHRRRASCLRDCWGCWGLTCSLSVRADQPYSLCYQCRQSGLSVGHLGNPPAEYLFGSRWKIHKAIEVQARVVKKRRI